MVPRYRVFKKAIRAGFCFESVCQTILHILCSLLRISGAYYILGRPRSSDGLTAIWMSRSLSAVRFREPRIALGHGSGYTVGTVPPSMTYSAPVIVAARSDARKAARLATSSGFDGRPIGMPPSESMMILLPPS